MTCSCARSVVPSVRASSSVCTSSLSVHRSLSAHPHLSLLSCWIIHPCSLAGSSAPAPVPPTVSVPSPSPCPLATPSSVTPWPPCNFVYGGARHGTQHTRERVACTCCLYLRRVHVASSCGCMGAVEPPLSPVPALLCKAGPWLRRITRDRTGTSCLRCA
ncbi:hypothetical protein B0H21DRAFT_715400 [Amylocystis lapponica]|nr:hypothetical protein B0H21DRAFT_715400 [Amylocystis lapponica]